MNAPSWLHNNARYARLFETDFATIVKNGRLRKRGLDALPLLSPAVPFIRPQSDGRFAEEPGDVRGCVLYTYFEPDRQLRATAEAAGITRIIHAFCRRSEAIVRGALRVQKNQVFREKVLEYLRDNGRVPVKYREEDYERQCWLDCYRNGNVCNKLSSPPPVGKSDLTWLKYLTKRYLQRLEDLSYVVLDERIDSGPNPISLLFQGGTLYSFFEPGLAVLSAARKVGIAEAWCVLSRFDRRRLEPLSIEVASIVREQPGLLQQHQERRPPPTGDHSCRAVLSANGYPTLGTGRLDAEGHWELPCGPCARAYERQFEVDCYPFR